MPVEWLGGVIIGVMNGTGVAAFAGYSTVLRRRWPLRSEHDARVIGSLWLALTIAFEFAFGRLVANQSWHELLADYKRREGSCVACPSARAEAKQVPRGRAWYLHRFAATDLSIRMAPFG